MKKIKALVSIVAAGALTLSLAACGSSNTTTSAAESTSVAESIVEAVAEETATTKIVVATTGTGPSPYVYVNEDGELDGYDIAVVREIFSRLPQYELEFATTEFASILTGIDAGYYQLGANNFGYNTSRGEKYLFSDVYNISTYGILVRDDNDEITSIADFAGHTTETSPSSENATMFQLYNDANPDAQITVNYIEDSNQTPISVSDGKIDFEFFSKVTLESQVESYGLTNVKIIDVPIDESNAFTQKVAGNFLVGSKENPELIEEVNEAFEAALADGTIAEISTKYLGENSANEQYLTPEYIQEAKDYIANDLAVNGSNN